MVRDATLLAQTQRRLCEHARRSGPIEAFRHETLALLAETIAHDAALFHELSPRVPLARAALVEIDLEALIDSRASWDELAVVLDCLREHALSRGGVATVTDALPVGSAGRRAWSARVAPMLDAAEVMLTHLVVDDRVVSGILLARRRGPVFDEREQDWMRELAPTLSVCDALCQMRQDGAPRGLAVELRCVDQRLTERQRELVVHVARGQTDSEIGRALELSANTVRNHLAEIRRRLGAANRAEIVRLAVLR